MSELYGQFNKQHAQFDRHGPARVKVDGACKIVEEVLGNVKPFIVVFEQKNNAKHVSDSICPETEQ